MPSLDHFWCLRQQFAVQHALHCFFTYILFLTPKHLTKLCLSCNSGRMYMTEVTPSYVPQTLQLESLESVPFRLTPNLQHFMTTSGIQGLFAPTLMHVARALSEKGDDLDSLISLFMRDDLFHLVQHSRFLSSMTPTNPATPAATTSNIPSSPPLYSPQQDLMYREKAMANSNAILKRIQFVSCIPEMAIATPSPSASSTSSTSLLTSSSSDTLQSPADALILQLIAAATNPALLAQTELSWYPWF